MPSRTIENQDASFEACDQAIDWNFRAVQVESKINWPGTGFGDEAKGYQCDEDIKRWVKDHTSNQC